MTGPDLIAPPKRVTVTFSLEPAYNVVTSLSLLTMAEDFTGLGEWVYRTLKTLSPERLRTNQIALMDATVHLADAHWPSFPAWVDDLAARDATTMRDRALEALLRRARKVVDGELPDPSQLLANRAAYLSLMEEMSRSGGESPDLSIWEEAHGLLNDPPARQDLIVNHLRTMWDEVLAAEWDRTLPMLTESIAAFESLDFAGLTVLQALTRVSLRDLPPPVSESHFAAIERLVLVPSAHTGPYLLRLGSLDGATERFAFGARIPEGTPTRISALSRSELLTRLNALADDTRLRILELLAREGELNTPDIIARLELSQSAASRHLEHLAATGYLTVRRHEGAKCYQLNPERIDHTFRALKEFCG